MVSIWLMKVKGAAELSSTQKIGLPREGRFSENCYCSSCAGLTRLRGRSPFGEAKARASIKLRKSLSRGWIAGSSPAMTANLLPILLDAGGAQSGQAMLVDGKLPGQEFVDGQGVAAAGFLKGEQATADRGNDFGLAADYPPFGPGRGQIRNC
jgi:hypothetical protein